MLSPIHVWWARRPLGVCRVVICASLWLDPVDDSCPSTFREAVQREMLAFANKSVSHGSFASTFKSASWIRLLEPSADTQPIPPIQLRELLLDFLAGFAAADAAGNEAFVSTARRLTQAARDVLVGTPGFPPFVVDPFAGGGSIPFEALRVGGQAFAGDLNPIAVLLNKAVLEYAPRYGADLASDLKSLGRRLHEEVARDCASLYAYNDDDACPVAYLWARTIRCEGPGCGCEVPVLRSLWIDRSRDATYAYELIPHRSHQIRANIVRNPDHRHVGPGTSRRSSVTCPLCGYTTARKRVEAQANTQGLGERLLAVAVDGPNGREYREPNQDDFAAIIGAEQRCEADEDWEGEFNEPLPYLRSIFNVHVYGFRSWRELFSARQYCYLSALARYASKMSRSESSEPERDVALRTLVGFVIAKTAMVSCNLARWRSDGGRMEAAFSMMALPMVWDWAEWNPFNVSMYPFSTLVGSVAGAIERAGLAVSDRGTAEQVSATAVPLPDDSAALFFTDPPYYDYVPYANLSDFSYVWLRRFIGKDYPTYFRHREAPKVEEIVQLAERNELYAHKTKEFFEQEIERAFVEGRRVTEPGGLGVIVFAHKSTEVWETLLNAVIRAGWIVTASWPIDTELATRFKAINTASLVSSIHLVCRPREGSDGSSRIDEVGDWRAVLSELPVRIHDWMPRLSREGVVGADAIFACLGPALEIYSRYSYVEKASGERVELREYLEQVWSAVAREALSMIFEDADTSNLEEDARLTAMWLWTLCTSANGGIGASVAVADDDTQETGGDVHGESGPGKVKRSAGFALEFDAARKIAQGLGAHLEDLDRVVEIKGDQARLRSVSERTPYLFGRDQTQLIPDRRTRTAEQLTLFEELEAAESDAGWGGVGLPPVGETTLDRVHQAMVLFAAGRTEAVKRFLVEEGIGRDARFWKLGQSLSALYPAGTDEKRWVDGVLARKKGLGF